MRETDVIMPTALQVCLDDVAWHNGHDERTSGRPSRSGIPRKHAPEDYLIVNEIGKAIGMKMLCPLCLGEWDKDNLLRGEVGITFDPKNWDRASQIDYPLAEKCKQTAEECEYLEYAVHGLMHGNYDADGRQLAEQEYFAPKERGGKRYPITMEDLRRRLDIFEKIYNSWGFQKKIRSIASPGGLPACPIEDLADMAQEFAKRGYLYWVNTAMHIEDSSKPVSGALWVNTNTRPSLRRIPWNGYDYDPTMLADFAYDGERVERCVLSIHWTNFLRFNPARNMEYLPDWIAYFKRQAEIFGLMLSKDISFAANQLLYVQHAKLLFEENKCIIDLHDVVNHEFSERTNEFYISFRNGCMPKECLGGKMEIYEMHTGFRTYKISHDENTVQILF